VRLDRSELARHQIRWPHGNLAGDRRDLERPAADRALEPEIAHQPRHRAARDRALLVLLQLAPDLAHAVDLEVLVPHPADVGAVLLVALHARRTPLRLA